MLKRSSGKNHYKWQGAAASIPAMHKYLRNHHPKKHVCVKCKKKGKTHYAKKRGRAYSRDRKDYLELCVPCHRKYDDLSGYLTQMWKSPHFRLSRSKSMKKAWTLERRKKLVERNKKLRGNKTKAKNFAHV